MTSHHVKHFSLSLMLLKLLIFQNTQLLPIAKGLPDAVTFLCCVCPGLQTQFGLLPPLP